MGIKKIALFRALHLGDLLCAMPAVRYLKQNFPEASLSWIGLKESMPLIQRYKAYIDELIVFPGFPGLGEAITDPATILNFLEEIRKRKFDLVIQMHGNGSIVNQMLLFSGARFLWAFHPAKSSESIAFTKTIDPKLGWPEVTWRAYPENFHEIHRHLSLMDAGIASLAPGEDLGRSSTNKTNDELFFPIFRADYQRYNALRLPVEANRFVIVHAGSRDSDRRWPVSYFARICQYCIDCGLKVVFTGTANEQGIIQQISELLEGAILDLSGKTDLGTLGVLIEQSAFVFSNCTGISHVTAALNKQAIIISMDGEPKRWGPLDHKRIYTHDWLQEPKFEKVFNVLKDKLRQVLSTTETHSI